MRQAHDYFAKLADDARRLQTKRRKSAEKHALRVRRVQETLQVLDAIKNKENR
jgi:hypothetical protein